ncbi:MAG: hypothetical protein PHP06_00550 [Clostridia bacterium]|nr:hypothetical protein [Clostridia bacterium]
MEERNILCDLIWLYKFENNVLVFYRAQYNKMKLIDREFSCTLLEFSKKHEEHIEWLSQYINELGVQPDIQCENMNRLVRMVARYNQKDVIYQNLLKMDIVLQQKLCKDYHKTVSGNDDLNLYISQLLFEVMEQEKKFLEYFKKILPKTAKL